MTVTSLGTLTVGAAVPAAALAVSAGTAGINSALPDLQARITALSAFSPQPVDFASQLALAQSVVTSIQTNITLGIPAPSIDLQIAIVVAQVAALEAAAAAIAAQLAIVASVGTSLAGGIIAAYAFSGATSALGSELDAAIAGSITGGGPSTHANVLVLATTDSATWAAMSAVFKTS